MKFTSSGGLYIKSCAAYALYRYWLRKRPKSWFHVELVEAAESRHDILNKYTTNSSHNINTQCLDPRAWAVIKGRIIHPDQMASIQTHRDSA
jgi:hypothetical protein